MRRAVLVVRLGPSIITAGPIVDGDPPVTSKLGTALGTYAVDQAGLPTRVTLEAGGEIVITRD